MVSPGLPGTGTGDCAWPPSRGQTAQTLPPSVSGWAAQGGPGQAEAERWEREGGVTSGAEGRPQRPPGPGEGAPNYNLHQALEGCSVK